MRFTKYLKEATSVKAKQDIIRCLVPLWNKFRMGEVDDIWDLCRVLNDIWKTVNKDVQFFDSSYVGYDTNSSSDRKYVITGYAYMKDMSIEILLYDDAYDYLEGLDKNTFFNFNTNRFLDELLVVMGHEYRHIEQYKDPKFRSIFKDNHFIKRETLSEYLKDYLEMDALAKEAAIMIVKQGVKDPPAFALYREGLPDSKDRRFVERFYKLVDKYVKEIK